MIHCVKRRRQLRNYDVWHVLVGQSAPRARPIRHILRQFKGQLPQSDALFHGAKPSHAVKPVLVGGDKYAAVKLALNFAALSISILLYCTFSHMT